MRFSIARGISGRDLEAALPKRYAGLTDAATRRRQRLTLVAFPDSHVVTSSSKKNRSPLRVSGLRYGTGYSCTLRAKSKAGLGKTSAKIKIPAF